MKKGFTLVELMGVIIILGVLATITIPIVENNIKDSEEKAYNEQVHTLEDLAYKWGMEHIALLPSENNAKEYLTIDELRESGYLNSDQVIDSRTDTPMTGCIEITYQEVNQQCTYEYYETCPN